MGNFYVLKHSDDNGLKIVSSNSPDLFDFEMGGYVFQFAGTQRECEGWIENYWYESNIPEDQQLYSTHKDDSHAIF